MHLPLSFSPHILYACLKMEPIGASKYGREVMHAHNGSDDQTYETSEKVTYE